MSRPIPNWALTQVPRSIRNNITWCIGHLQGVTTISSSVPTEANFSFQLGDIIDLSGLGLFFDQYCIYSVVATLTPRQSTPGTGVNSFGTVVTAIDYDNINALGTVSAVLSFQSAMQTELSIGQSVQRYIKPTVAPALYASNNLTLQGFAVGRFWVDSANINVPHYGLRSIYEGNTQNGLVVAYDYTYTLGFRNNI